MSNLQITLSIFKPHISNYPFITNFLRKLIADNNLMIVKEMRIQLSRPLSDRFYEVHKNKFFYNRLQTFMCR